MGKIERWIGSGGLESPPLARVVVVSPILLYREGLASSLAADGRLDVIAAVDSSNAEAVISHHRPDAVIFDASGEGVALARHLRRADAAVILVGFGISESATHVVACAEAGIAAFINENSSIEALVLAVFGALNGEFRCSPRVSAILCERLATLADGADARAFFGTSSLTRRELEVATRVSEGLSNKEIAIDLRIGPATVKNHVHNILEKLGVRRRAAIATLVSERQLRTEFVGR